MDYDPACHALYIAEITMLVKDLPLYDRWLTANQIANHITESDADYNSVFSVVPSDNPNIYHVKITDDGRSRLWHVEINGDEAIIAIHNREIGRSSNLHDISTIILSNRSKLVHEFNRRRILKSIDDGFYGTIIIYKLRKLAIAHKFNYDISTSNIIIFGLGLQVIVNFDKSQIFSVMVTTRMGETKAPYNMADPSFDPDQFCNNVFENIKKTEELMVTLPTMFHDIWKQN